MGGQWENLKCGISWKRPIVERNGRKFGTWVPTVHVCRVLLMPDSLSLAWGHSVHFAKFPILRFSKGYLWEFMRTLLTIGECRLLLFLTTGQVLQNLWHFEILTLESLGKPKMWNISKTTDRIAKRIIDSRAKRSAISPTLFIGAHPNFLKT